MTRVQKVALDLFPWAAQSHRELSKCKHCRRVYAAAISAAQQSISERKWAKKLQRIAGDPTRRGR